MAQETPRHRSPDGLWEWDGTRWVPAAREEARAASPRPAQAGTGRRWSGRRVLIAALVVGLLGLAASGTGSFLLASNANGSGGGVPCSDGSDIRCLPVKQDAIVKQLKSSGYGCTQRGTYWRCELAIGLTRYSAELSAFEATGGGGGSSLKNVRVLVSFDGDDAPGKGPMTFLKWFASVPFADDPDAASVTTSWLSRQVNRHGHQKATINGYRYELDASKARTIVLDASGGY